MLEIEKLQGEYHLNKRDKNLSSGFTLIELSIVLVVIGLIVGGILGGQELIHGASVRATISQMNKYNTAVNTFYMKYGAIPGDYANANTYLSGFVGAGGNGNGDGLVGQAAGSANTYGATTAIATVATLQTGLEYQNFWAMLSLAGLVEGNFGTGITALAALNVGVNFPATKITSNVGVLAWGNTADNLNYYYLGASGVNAATTAVYGSNFLSSVDAFAIDTKLDDGYSNTGYVVARSGAGSATSSLEIAPTASCVTSTVTWATSAPTTYLAATSSSGSGACSLRVRFN